MGPLTLTPAVCALVFSADPARLDAELELVPFPELAAAPELWLGERVETVVQLAGPVEGTWTGFLSGFDPSTHVAWRAWGDAQALWDAEEHAAPAGRFYTTAVGPDLAGMPAYSRLRLVVRVAAVHAGRGWLEVVEAAPTVESLTEGALLHAIRGLEQLADGSPALAASELERALRTRLPVHQRGPLEAALADARRRATPVAGDERIRVVPAGVSRHGPRTTVPRR